VAYSGGSTGTEHAWVKVLALGLALIVIAAGAIVLTLVSR
jgi:hypothetical protein